MSKTRKLILLLVCAVLLMSSLTLVACGGNKEYAIYVRSLGGLGVSNTTVTVSVSGKTVSGKTDKNGKYVFKAKKGVYDVTVSDLPLGYSIVNDASYKTSADKFTLVIYVKSAVIKGDIPDDKVYKEGDVIYDFSITDKTDSSNPVTYTLSEVLENKRMVLLNFWSTNCDPCMREMPELELAYRQYQDTAEVFGLNVPVMGTQRQSDVNSTRRLTYTDADGNSYSLTFPLALDSNSMPYHFGITAIPVTVIVDRYGVIAKIHIGSMDKSNFAALFAKYTSDDYEQDSGLGDGDGPSDDQKPEWARPDVTQPDSSVIEAAINGANFNGSWYPETETSDAEYSWPWLVGETNGEQYIYPSNHEKNYSFATIYTKVTIDNVAEGSNVVLAFDLQWSCENLGDYFYVIINDNLVYEYTGTEQWGKWQDCYALVADEPGEYTLCLMYFKDQELSEGADTARVKNVRLMSIEDIKVPSLDMPRDAARNWNGSGFNRYVTAVKDAQGFYHKDTADGPYILADLMGATAFNKRLETNWSIAEFAINNYFNYSGVDEDDPAYDPTKDDTQAITVWAMAANNSELYGLTLVNDDLIALLNTFFKTHVNNFNDNMWLEVCKYFDHYGTDKTDTGINTPERNPIRGLLNITAVPMVKAHEGPFADLNNIPDEYKNQVVLTRLIVPRGFMYVFAPEKSGVYRFRSQSKELSDTMAWLLDYDKALYVNDAAVLVSTDGQLENPNENYNFVLTYYLEAGQKYILATCFADMAGTGEYTLTTEYLGEHYYAWQFAANNNFTTADEEMTQVKNILNVQPVAHKDSDGVVRYYNAKKDANGNYVKDASGNYVPNLKDPIYVDFLSGARFFDYGSLENCFIRSNEDTVRNTIGTIYAAMWGKVKPTGGWVKGTTLASIKGSAITDADWDNFITRLYGIYGDDVYLDDDGIIAGNFNNAVTIGDVITVIKTFYLNLFDQRYIKYDDKYGIDESRYIDYTELVYSYYQKALANQGSADRNYADKGCVIVTEELKNALDMFCKRVGGFPELDTDWLRLCAHYEYIGPYVAD